MLKGIKVCAARVCLRVFILMYAREWTGIQFVVGQEAMRMAKGATATWLMKHGIMHCRRCLETGQLKKAEVDGQPCYLCAKCYEGGVACGAVKPRVELVKP